MTGSGYCVYLGGIIVQSVLSVFQTSKCEINVNLYVLETSTDASFKRQPTRRENVNLLLLHGNVNLVVWVCVLGAFCLSVVKTSTFLVDNVNLRVR